MMNRENEGVKAVAETYMRRVWDDKDLKAIDELIHPKCVVHSLLGDFYGPESLKNIVQTWLLGFPDLVIKNTAVISEQDLVVIQWQAQGSHQGEFKGIKPIGKPVSYTGITVYRINHGKITEYWAYLDMKNILDQIDGV